MPVYIKKIKKKEVKASDVLKNKSSEELVLLRTRKRKLINLPIVINHLGSNYKQEGICTDLSLVGCFIALSDKENYNNYNKYNKNSLIPGSLAQVSLILEEDQKVIEFIVKIQRVGFQEKVERESDIEVNGWGLGCKLCHLDNEVYNEIKNILMED